MSLPAPLRTDLPVHVAPMAGGVSTPGLVRAAQAAGSFGQLAAGYLTAPALAERLRAVREVGTTGFGVNVFVPTPSPVDPAAYRRYADRLAPEAARLGVPGFPPAPREDDDDWAATIDLLVQDPVPVVSFTFGCPDAATLRRLRRAGSVLLQTVTTAAEARHAADAGVDALVVQGHAAGGHAGTWDPRARPVDRPLGDLVREVVAATPLPVLAAGGISGPDDVGAVLAAGAEGAVVGTAVLLADESGTNATHRRALADPAPTPTVLTHAFTGRAARGLRNRFVLEHDADAPLGYPALHHLTAPVRAAAAAAGDPSVLHLWAGTGRRHARAAPLASILGALGSQP